MKEPAIKQFKLTNDDEIVCEVLEWDSKDNSAILVRCPLRIVQGEDMERGLRFYAFRPWMGFIEDPKILHTINASHVIGEVTPSNDLMKHYAGTLIKLEKNANVKKHDFNMDKLENMNDDEIEDFIQYHLEQEDEEQIEEELGQNVVKFKPKDTMH